MPGFEIENADKGVHFIFHLVFTICWYLFLNFGYGFRFKILRIAFLLSLFYGIAIEFCQEYLTTYRSGDPMDVLANSVGALSAVIAMFILQKSLKLIQ
nr:VanZ family protein [Flavobacterium sp. CYK-55]